MSLLRFWEVKIQFEESPEIRRRINSFEIIVGSSPKAELRIPQPAPEIAVRIVREEKENDLPALYIIESPGNLEFEVAQGASFKKVRSYKGPQIPVIKVSGATIHITDVTDQRRVTVFEPERWAAGADKVEEGAHAFWHFRQGVLVESGILEHKKNEPLPLKCGYAVHWSLHDPLRLRLFEYDGISQSIELAPGRNESFRGQFLDNIFLITRLPERKALRNVPVPEFKSSEGNLFRRSLLGAGATWILLMAIMKLVPAKPITEEVSLEEISPELAKIILEAPKSHDGRNGQDGGGGSEQASHQDKRGGSGFESNRMTESAGHDEILVRDKGALAALSKTEKVLGGGVLKALEAGGAIANALSALDEGVKAGKVKVAGFSPSGASGKGGVNGVMGALGSLGGGGKGGAGLGVGGVGTEGFGGGGGGGKGAGYGGGLGSGLGAGKGNRDISFDSGNVVVRGGLERSEVDAVIQENLSQIRYCYNKGLRTNPSLRGKVNSNFTIVGDGSVKQSRVAGSTLASGEVEDCIKGRIASWRFPMPRGGGEVTVNYPFLLNPN